MARMKNAVPQLVEIVPDGKTKKCFLISMIGSEDSAQRIHANNFKNYIAEVLEDEYEIKRADDERKSVPVLNYIVRNIHDADLIIADLTGNNPNVYYELGIAHCFKKPTICFASPSGCGLPFDVRGMNVIFYNGFDYKSVLDARASLEEYVDSIDTYEADNPITSAFRSYEVEWMIESMKSGGKDQEMAVMMEMMSRVVNDVALLRNNMKATPSDKPNSFERKAIKNQMAVFQNELEDYQKHYRYLQDKLTVFRANDASSAAISDVESEMMNLKMKMEYLERQLYELETFYMRP